MQIFVFNTLVGNVIIEKDIFGLMGGHDLKDNKNNNIWKLTTIVAVLLLAVVSVLYGLGVGWKKKAADKAPFPFDVDEK